MSFKNTSGRMYFLDYARATASIFVILDHLMVAFIEHDKWISETINGGKNFINGQFIFTDVLKNLIIQIRHYANFINFNYPLRDIGVKLFFILSGFLMMQCITKQKLNDFLIK